MLELTDNINYVQHNFPALTIGIAGKTGNTVNYKNRQLEEIRNDEKQLLSTVTGIQKKNIVFLKQVHGDSVITIESLPEEETSYYAEADGIITDVKNICLVIRTADCVPIFIYDSKQDIVAAVHAGWKGCQLNIAYVAAQKMVSLYGANRETLRVWLLPSIGPESFEVKNDVASLFQYDTIMNNDRLYVDLWSHVTRELVNYGVPGNNIFTSKICTYQNNGSFFSYRRGDTGRNLNFSFLK